MVAKRWSYLRLWSAPGATAAMEQLAQQVAALMQNNQKIFQALM